MVMYLRAVKAFYDGGKYTKREMMRVIHNH